MITHLEEDLLKKVSALESENARLKEQLAEAQSSLGKIALECVTVNGPLDTSEVYHWCYKGIVQDLTKPATEQAEIMSAALDALAKEQGR